ncbi:hypothetical protein [Candidatus Ichthyocystis hellenicum]|nr:hypothetical protein [Candidatus Ichthyocystis hellenicum]
MPFLCVSSYCKNVVEVERGIKISYEIIGMAVDSIFIVIVLMVDFELDCILCGSCPKNNH